MVMLARSIARSPARRDREYPNYARIRVRVCTLQFAPKEYFAPANKGRVTR